MICEDEIMNAAPDIPDIFTLYREGQDTAPLFIFGEALSILKQLPSETVDCCMTSPPYWNKREYHNQGISLESTYQEYIADLLEVFAQVKRVLKPRGSLWLNIGDSYHNKTLVGIPWRITLKLIDEQGWILRNSVIWNKVKGGLDNTRDRLCGTGTTMLVAQNFGRKSVGIDLSREYLQIAEERCLRLL